MILLEQLKVVRENSINEVEDLTVIIDNYSFIKELKELIDKHQVNLSFTCAQGIILVKNGKDVSIMEYLE